MPTRLGVAVNGTQCAFLKQIAIDLRPLGHQLEYRETMCRGIACGWLQGGLRGHGPDCLEPGEAVKGESNSNDDSFGNGIHKGLRALHVDVTSKVFRRLEDGFTQSSIQSAGDIVLRDIRPMLEVLTMEPGHDFLEYVRMYQNIRSSPGIGKQVVGLIRDAGRIHSPLMGVVAVGSPVYFQGERDFFLGWPNPNLVRRAARIRQLGLARIGQLVLFVAIPPYDRLSSVRLLAPIPFTAEFAGEFQVSRRQPLVGVVCTAGLGEHVPALRKHLLRHLSSGPVPESENPELYQRLSGLAKKRSRVLEITSNETRRLATLLRKAAPLPTPRKPNWEHDLSVAMRVVALPLSLFDANFVATYYASLSADHDQALRFAASPPTSNWLAFNKISAEWRAFALRKYGDNAVVRVRQVEDLLVSTRIKRQVNRTIASTSVSSGQSVAVPRSIGKATHRRVRATIDRLRDEIEVQHSAQEAKSAGSSSPRPERKLLKVSGERRGK